MWYLFSNNDHTHWYVVLPGLVMPHASWICVSIGSGNGSLPIQCQSIVWTNADQLFMGPSGTNLSKLKMIIQKFTFNKMFLKMLFWSHSLTKMGNLIFGYLYPQSRIIEQKNSQKVTKILHVKIKVHWNLLLLLTTVSTFMTFKKMLNINPVTIHSLGNLHDDLVTWRRFPYYWPFVMWTQQSLCPAFQKRIWAL